MCFWWSRPLNSLSWWYYKPDCLKWYHNTLWLWSKRNKMLEGWSSGRLRLNRLDLWLVSVFFASLRGKLWQRLYPWSPCKCSFSRINSRFYRTFLPYYVSMIRYVNFSPFFKISCRGNFLAKNIKWMKVLIFPTSAFSIVALFIHFCPFSLCLDGRSSISF